MTIATIKNNFVGENGTHDGTHDGTHEIVNPPTSNEMDIIANVIKANPKITRSELAKLIGKSTRTVQRLLESNTKIKFIGSGNNGHWEILSDESNKNDN